MRIDPAITTGVITARPTSSVQKWLVGQLLTIGVIGRIDENSIRLTVDGREAIANTTLDLKPGGEYTVRVIAGGAQPQLSLMPPTPPEKSAPSVLSPALAQALPRQQPLNEVLPRLLQPLSPTLQKLEGGPEIQARLNTIVDGLPGLPALSRPAELEKALLTAGPMLETSLAQVSERAGQPPPSTDLKWQLLALRQFVDDRFPSQSGAQTPALATPSAREEMQPRHPSNVVPAIDVAPPDTPLSELIDDVDAGIARITTHQLQHLAAADNGEFFVYAEMPFRTPVGIDTLALEIEGDRPDGSSEESTMALNLEVPLDSLGALRARIGLAGNRLAITLWSEESQLRDLIVTRVGELEHNLTRLGFDLTPIAVREVSAPDPLRHRPQRLVDTEI